VKIYNLLLEANTYVPAVPVSSGLDSTYNKMKIFRFKQFNQQDVKIDNLQLEANTYVPTVPVSSGLDSTYNKMKTFRFK